MENIENRENKEKEIKDREVVLHFIRHGSSDYKSRDDQEGFLTDKGREQASDSAKKLMDEIPEGSVVSFYSSQLNRARETIDIIRDSFEKNESHIPHGQGSKPFKKFEVSPEATREYLGYAYRDKVDPIATWLNNPTEAILDSEKNFHNFYDKISNFTKKLPSNGPDIHMLIVSHSGPLEFFAGRMIRKTDIAPLNNCEEFQIKIPRTDSPSILNIRGTSNEVGTK